MKFSQLILSQGLNFCEVGPNIFQTSTFTRYIILAIYLDDILLSERDISSITRVKAYLHRYLTIRDLGTPKYFLGIDFAYQTRKLVLNQQKYVLDIFTEVRLLVCKPRAFPIDSKPKFWDSTSPLFVNVYAYRQLVGKLIYLTAPLPDITYTVSLLCQLMHAAQEIHRQELFTF